MKKQWLVMALVAGLGLAANSFADVQNIRLSGDIRLRGYYLNGTDLDLNAQGDAQFISQRTRVTVEADLEDHVLVVVTLKAEGLWGSDNETDNTSGAGGSSSSSINRRWDLGVTEAYLQLNELFYLPATLKLGRQYLNYGHGLILSSVDQEYNYDAARLVLDYYPLTIDLVGGQLVNNQGFTAASSSAGASDLLFINARYEMSDSMLKDLEAYFGWVSQGHSGPVASPRVPPTVGGASPMLIGLRGDLTPADALKMWFEVAYEFGTDGTAFGTDLSAYIGNLGFSYSMKDSNWSPSFHANYTYASGGGSGGRHTFRPWFDYVEGQNGYLFSPALSNIQIFNLGASVKPYENTTLSLQAYYYLKVDKDGVAGSNGNVDFGGPAWSGVASGVNSRDLGWEIDAILGYDYSKDVRVQLVYGMFIPEGAYKNSAAVSAVAHEVRGEVNVKF